MSIESHVLHISILTRPFKSTKSELRILVYSVGISEEEHEITPTSPALPQYRLFALFGTTIQITRDIYRFCHITAVIDVKVPHLQPQWYWSFAAWTQAITIPTPMLEGNARIWYFESIKGSSWCSVLHFGGYLIGRSRLRFIGSGRVLNAGLCSSLPFVVVDR